jgi:hypothetical protein
MKKIILSVHLFFGIFCFSQSAQELNNARINKSIYDSQVTNSTMVKALNDLQASAKANKANQFKELDEKFEFNFAQKERLDAKFTTLNQKKIELEKMIIASKTEVEKEKLNRKLKQILSEFEKNQQKLKENEAELKILQENYNSLLEK